jgi:hypothetical protein
MSREAREEGLIVPQKARVPNTNGHPELILVYDGLPPPQHACLIGLVAAGSLRRFANDLRARWRDEPAATNFYAPGRWPRTLVVLGKNPFGELI